MFRPLRNNRGGKQTHRQLVRAELGESVDHALRAAGYAAGGVKAKVGPAATRVRGTAAKLTNTRTEEKVSSRWPKLAGLLAVGALMGAATAFVLRRRRQRQWEEYDPMATVAEERSNTTAPAETATGSEQ